MSETENKQELPKEEADLQERMDAFNNELRPLLAKYELGIAAIAKITVDGRVAADPFLITTRKHIDEKAVDKKELATA